MVRRLKLHKIEAGQGKNELALAAKLKILNAVATEFEGKSEYLLLDDLLSRLKRAQVQLTSLSPRPVLIVAASAQCQELILKLDVAGAAKEALPGVDPAIVEVRKMEAEVVEAAKEAQALSNQLVDNAEWTHEDYCSALRGLKNPDLVRQIMSGQGTAGLNVQSSFGPVKYERPHRMPTHLPCRTDHLFECSVTSSKSSTDELTIVEMRVTKCADLDVSPIWVGSVVQATVADVFHRNALLLAQLLQTPVEIQAKLTSVPLNRLSNDPIKAIPIRTNIDADVLKGRLSLLTKQMSLADLL
jgi:hypothetical protein